MMRCHLPTITHRRSPWTGVLLLFVIASSCDPAAPVSNETGEVEYAIVSGAPMFYQSYPPRQLQGLRLQLTGDSARLYHPMMNFDESYRAYRGDTVARYPDSSYLVYQAGDNDSLHAVAHFGERSQTLVAIATPPLHYAGLSEALVGRAYRVRVEQHNYVLYFDGEMGTQQETVLIIVFLYGLDASGQLSPVDRRLSWKQPPAVLLTDTAAAGGGSLFVAADSSGQPQVYLVRANSDNTEDYVGPYPAVPYRAPTARADAVDSRVLIDRLNQGRVLAEVPRGEPGEKEIKYGYPEDFNQGSGLPSVDELARLDMEFRSDGTYVIFVSGQPAGGGRWKLSQDGGLLTLAGNRSLSFPPPFPQVMDWSRDSLRLRIPVAVQTRRPYGTSLMSYYVPDVAVTVVR